MIAEGREGSARGRLLPCGERRRGVPVFSELAGNRLADGAPAGDDLIAFKAHGEELVRKERVGEGEVGTDMVGAGFPCLASAAFMIASPQS